MLPLCHAGWSFDLCTRKTWLLTWSRPCACRTVQTSPRPSSTWQNSWSTVRIPLWVICTAAEHRCGNLIFNGLTRFSSCNHHHNFYPVQGLCNLFPSFHIVGISGNLKKKNTHINPFLHKGLTGTSSPDLPGSRHQLFYGPCDESYVLLDIPQQYSWLLARELSY